MRRPSREGSVRVAHRVVLVWAAAIAVFIVVMVLSGVLPPDQRAIFLMGGGLLLAIQWLYQRMA